MLHSYRPISSRADRISLTPSVKLKSNDQCRLVYEAEGMPCERFSGVWQGCTHDGFDFKKISLSIFGDSPTMQPVRIAQCSSSFPSLTWLNRTVPQSPQKPL